MERLITTHNCRFTTIVPALRMPGMLLAYGLQLLLCLNFVQRSGHDMQRMLELVFLLVSACLMASRAGVFSLPSPIASGIKWALLTFFALGILSSALAFSSRLAFYETASLMLMLLTALTIADWLARKPAGLVRMLQLFGAVAGLYAAKILSVYTSVWLIAANPDRRDFTPGFSNIRHFNHVQTLGLPLLVLLYVVTPAGSRIRKLCMATMAFWWSVLFATGGRGTEVSLCAAALLVLVLRRRAAVPFLRAMLISCVIGAIVYELGFVIAPTLMGRPPFGAAGVLARTIADPTSGRTRLWQCALDLIAGHPLLGVGPLHFAHYGVVANIGAHPHNWMLQIAAEWGLPALLALCTAVVLAFRGLWRAGLEIPQADTLNQNMFSAWLVIGIALLIDASVSGSLVMPQSQMMIVLYIACATGWAWSVGPKLVPSAAGLAGFSGRVVVIIAAFTMAYGVAPQFIAKATGAEATAAELAANGPSYWWPRVWRAGYF